MKVISRIDACIGGRDGPREFDVIELQLETGQPKQVCIDVGVVGGDPWLFSVGLDDLARAVAELHQANEAFNELASKGEK